MVKRKSTLKKKVSKRQTRKFSKKGGRKSMKKPARKQQKIKGGQIGFKTSQRKRQDTEASRKRQDENAMRWAVDGYARGFFLKLHKRDYQYLVNHYAEIFKKEGLNFNAIFYDVNENIDTYNENINPVRRLLENCNKDEHGKSILKTPNLGRDYIVNKFEYEEIGESKMQLVMKHEKGEPEKVEIPLKTFNYDVNNLNESNGYQKLIDTKHFVIDKTVYDKIKTFLDSFDGKGTPEEKTRQKEQFLNNILTSESAYIDKELKEELKKETSSDE